MLISKAAHVHSDAAKRRFEVLSLAKCSPVLRRCSVNRWNINTRSEHDNIEAIYKKLQERRETADVTAVLKELHRIINAAIQTQGAGVDHAEGLAVDLSCVDFEKLKNEFTTHVVRKHSAIKDIRDIVEAKLKAMLASNPLRMDFNQRYQEIVAEYNREKDRVTVEETFRKLLALAQSVDQETERAVREGLTGT